MLVMLLQWPALGGIRARAGAQLSAAKMRLIVAFIKSNNNPTLNDYNSVSERLFADNCQVFLLM
jgi:hypothetical protein